MSHRLAGPHFGHAALSGQGVLGFRTPRWGAKCVTLDEILPQNEPHRPAWADESQKEQA